MAKPKAKNATVQYVLIVAVILIIAQIGYLFIFSQKNPPKPFMDVVEKQLSEMDGLSPKRRAQMKIQMAIREYMRVNNGKPPKALNDLVTRGILPSVPTDPETKTAFTYRVDGVQFYVGETTTTDDTAIASAGGLPKVNTLSDEERQQVLLASLKDPSAEKFVYDPAGKRDPFAPFEIRPIAVLGDTPLTRHPLSQFRLTAVLAGIEDPKAIVELSEGLGYTIKKGDRIGTNNGVVVEILDDRVMVLEQNQDFTGQMQNKTVELPLRTKVDERKAGASGRGR